MKLPDKPFLETLYHLRTKEHVILYNKLITISHADEQDAIAFLEGEYERESTDYPFEAPLFSATAALWGAKTVYLAAQLFLFREHEITELRSLFPIYNGAIDASVMLSADLCLRFLPAIKYALEAVDANDPLISMLEDLLKHFPYSGIGQEKTVTIPDLTVVLNNDCLKQLYLDRITENKAEKWIDQPIIKSGILANIGDYKNDLWREFNN